MSELKKSDDKPTIDEHRIIPFRYEVDINSINFDVHKQNFIQQLNHVIDFEENQTAWLYPEIENNKLYLKAISTNKNGDEPTIIDLQNAFNNAGSEKSKTKEV